MRPALRPQGVRERMDDAQPLVEADPAEQGARSSCARRAAGSEPSRTAVSRPRETCRSPSRAIPSQIGWKVVER